MVGKGRKTEYMDISLLDQNVSRLYSYLVLNKLWDLIVSEKDIEHFTSYNL